MARSGWRTSDQTAHNINNLEEAQMNRSLKIVQIALVGMVLWLPGAAFSDNGNANQGTSAGSASSTANDNACSAVPINSWAAEVLGCGVDGGGPGGAY